jgi:hypothetical protein
MDVFSSDEYYKLIDNTIEYDILCKLLLKSKDFYEKEKKSQVNHFNLLKFKYELPKKLRTKSIRKIYKLLKKKVEKKQKKISSIYKITGFK